MGSEHERARYALKASKRPTMAVGDVLQCNCSAWVFRYAFGVTELCSWGEVSVRVLEGMGIRQ